jgi:hypothetical protein
MRRQGGRASNTSAAGAQLAGDSEGAAPGRRAGAAYVLLQGFRALAAAPPLSRARGAHPTRAAPAQALVVRLRQALTILLLEECGGGAGGAGALEPVLRALRAAHDASERAGLLPYAEFYVDGGARGSLAGCAQLQRSDVCQTCGDGGPPHLGAGLLQHHWKRRGHTWRGPVHRGLGRIALQPPAQARGHGSGRLVPAPPRRPQPRTQPLCMPRLSLSARSSWQPVTVKPAASPQPRRPGAPSAARRGRSQRRRLCAGGGLPALEARRRLQLLPLPLRVRGGHQGGHPGHGEPRRAGAPGAGAAATPASAASLLCFEAATKAAIGGDMDTESRGEQARPAPAPLPPRTAREGPCGCSGSPCGCVSLL